MAIKKCYLYIKEDGKNVRCLLHSNGKKILYFEDSLIPKVTFSILPDPNDSKIQLYSPGYEQVNNSISVTPETEVEYTVTHEGYIPKTDTILITEETLNYPVKLQELYKLTIVTTPEDAIVTLTPEGGEPIVSKSIEVLPDTVVTYSVEKEGYTSIVNKQVTVDTPIKNVPEEIYKLCTLTIAPYPPDAIVKLKPEGGEEITSNTITVTTGTNVQCTVTRDGYETSISTIPVTSSTPSPYEITLNVDTYKLDVEDYQYTNSNGDVVLYNYIGSGQVIVTPNIETEYEE